MGASEGIGRALAVAFAEAGTDVVLTSRSGPKIAVAASMVEAHRRHPGQRVSFAAFDASDAAMTAAHVEKLCADNGPPDYVILCPGFSHPAYFEDLTLEDHRAMMEQNYFSQLHVIRAIMPVLTAARSGHILTTSSALGRMGLFGFSGYCASKFALVGLSEALRSELRPSGVRVTCLCPPAVQTPGFDRENAIKPEAVRAAEAKASVLAPEAVARYVLMKLPSNPALIVPGLSMRLILAAHRLSPALVHAFARRPAPR